MNASSPYPEWLRHVPLDALLRVDLGLEGAWSETVRPLWTPDGEHIHMPGDELRHPQHRPSLELYFPGSWIGMHCCKEVGGEFVFDRHLAEGMLCYIEARRSAADGD